MLVRVIYFTAPWCQPCLTFGPRLRKFAEDNGIEVRRVDVDEHPEIAQRVGVQSLPTTLWYADDEHKETLVGVVDDYRLRQALFAAKGI